MATAPTAKVITSLNLKGGVGKTHICWLIAGECHRRGKRCLILDLDKQANISTSLAPELSSDGGTDRLFDPADDPQVSNLIKQTSLANVDLIPGNFNLERFNVTDPSSWTDSNLHLSLADAIQEVVQFYDYILFDCPADISLITYAALSASGFVLIPLEAAQWGALGTQHVVKTLEHVQQQANSRLALLGFVVSRYKRARKYQKEYLPELYEHYRGDVFETIIPDLAAFEQSVNDRIPIAIHSPSSHASRIARRFFDEVEQRIEGLTRSRKSGGAGGLSEPIHAVA